MKSRLPLIKLLLVLSIGLLSTEVFAKSEFFKTVNAKNKNEVISIIHRVVDNSGIYLHTIVNTPGRGYIRSYHYSLLNSDKSVSRIEYIYKNKGITFLDGKLKHVNGQINIKDKINIPKKYSDDGKGLKENRETSVAFSGKISDIFSTDIFLAANKDLAKSKFAHVYITPLRVFFDEYSIKKKAASKYRFTYKNGARNDIDLSDRGISKTSFVASGNAAAFDSLKTTVEELTKLTEFGFSEAQSNKIYSQLKKRARSN